MSRFKHAKADDASPGNPPDTRADAYYTVEAQGAYRLLVVLSRLDLHHTGHKNMLGMPVMLMFCQYTTGEEETMATQ